MESKNLEELKNSRSMKGKKINNYLEEGYDNQIVKEINAQLRDKLNSLGRKNFLKMLRHFTFNDNNTKFISAYDFNKILKNFNIKLPVDDIDEIFYYYEIDKIHKAMDFILYLNNLILCYFSEESQNDIFNTIAKREKNLIMFIMGEIIISKKMKKRTG